MLLVVSGMNAMGVIAQDTNTSVTTDPTLGTTTDPDYTTGGVTPYYEWIPATTAAAMTCMDMTTQTVVEDSYCDATTNPDLIDTDGDGIPDYADSDPSSTDGTDVSGGTTTDPNTGTTTGDYDCTEFNRSTENDDGSKVYVYGAECPDGYSWYSEEKTYTNGSTHYKYTSTGTDGQDYTYDYWYGPDVLHDDCNTAAGTTVCDYDGDGIPDSDDDDPYNLPPCTDPTMSACDPTEPWEDPCNYTDDKYVNDDGVEVYEYSMECEDGYTYTNYEEHHANGSYFYRNTFMENGQLVTKEEWYTPIECDYWEKDTVDADGNKVRKWGGRCTDGTSWVTEEVYHQDGTVVWTDSYTDAEGNTESNTVEWNQLDTTTGYPGDPDYPATDDDWDDDWNEGPDAYPDNEYYCEENTEEYKQDDGSLVMVFVTKCSDGTHYESRQTINADGSMVFTDSYTDSATGETKTDSYTVDNSVPTYVEGYDNDDYVTGEEVKCEQWETKEEMSDGSIVYTHGVVCSDGYKSESREVMKADGTIVITETWTDDSGEAITDTYTISPEPYYGDDDVDVNGDGFIYLPPTDAAGGEVTCDEFSHREDNGDGTYTVYSGFKCTDGTFEEWKEVYSFEDGSSTPGQDPTIDEKPCKTYDETYEEDGNTVHLTVTECYDGTTHNGVVVDENGVVVSEGFMYTSADGDVQEGWYVDYEEDGKANYTRVYTDENGEVREETHSQRVNEEKTYDATTDSCVSTEDKVTNDDGTVTYKYIVECDGTTSVETKTLKDGVVVGETHSYEGADGTAAESNTENGVTVVTRTYYDAETGETKTDTETFQNNRDEPGTATGGYAGDDMGRNQCKEGERAERNADGTVSYVHYTECADGTVKEEKVTINEDNEVVEDSNTETTATGNVVTYTTKLNEDGSKTIVRTEVDVLTGEVKTEERIVKADTDDDVSEPSDEVLCSKKEEKVTNDDGTVVMVYTKTCEDGTQSVERKILGDDGDVVEKTYELTENGEVKEKATTTIDENGKTKVEVEYTDADGNTVNHSFETEDDILNDDSAPAAGDEVAQLFEVVENDNGTVTVKYPDGTEITYADPNAEQTDNTNDGNGTTNVPLTYSVSVSLLSGPESLKVNETGTYVVRVINTGTADVAISLGMTLPSELESGNIVSVNPTSINIAPGQSEDITITVNLPTGYALDSTEIPVSVTYLNGDGVLETAGIDLTFETPQDAPAAASVPGFEGLFVVVAFLGIALRRRK